ncbi:MAG: hypothetical protein LBU40_07075, partial [Methanobrevibacter sp.]|nr:hypothetical protein [Methanobrevibacter sp.]
QNNNHRNQILTNKNNKNNNKRSIQTNKRKKYYTRYKNENPIYLALAFSKNDIDCEFKERLE